jgi:hypothetical protein
MVRINENTLRKIIRTALYEAINEIGTNMQSLYHFTYLSRLVEIVESGRLILHDADEYARNGRNYMSFTRHKSALEGFADARNLEVRIEADGTALSNIRGADVIPYEFYSPGGPNDWHHEPSAKTAYGNYLKKWHRRNEYFNQAEESFEGNMESIPISVVKRVDILVTDTTNLDYLKEIMSTGSELIDKIFIYTDWRDYNLQTNKCTPIRELSLFKYGKKAVEQ